LTEKVFVKGTVVYNQKRHLGDPMELYVQGKNSTDEDYEKWIAVVIDEINNDAHIVALRSTIEECREVASRYIAETYGKNLGDTMKSWRGDKDRDGLCRLHDPPAYIVPSVLSCGIVGGSLLLSLEW